jgi:hypothetical protein
LRLQEIATRFIKPIATYVLIKEEKKVCPYYYKFDNTCIICLFIEENSKGWGFEGNEVT